MDPKVSTFVGLFQFTVDMFFFLLGKSWALSQGNFLNFWSKITANPQLGTWDV